MNLKELILQLVQVAIAFAFPTIWNWLIEVFPWWTLDPETTLGLIIGIAITVVSWLLGLLGIKRIIVKMQAYGYIR